MTTRSRGRAATLSAGVVASVLVSGVPAQAATGALIDGCLLPTNQPYTQGADIDERASSSVRPAGPERGPVGRRDRAAAVDPGAGAEPVRAARGLWRHGKVTVIPFEPGDECTRAIAVATSGRILLEVDKVEGSPRRFAIWRNGVRRPLTTPAGWCAYPPVELTETGVVLTDVLSPGGATRRPITWRTGQVNTGRTGER
jgi:hypothetical protein